jgi:hypothetical protein
MQQRSNNKLQLQLQRAAGWAEILRPMHSSSKAGFQVAGAAAQQEQHRVAQQAVPKAAQVSCSGPLHVLLQASCHLLLQQAEARNG